MVNLTIDGRFLWWGHQCLLANKILHTKESPSRMTSFTYHGVFLSYWASSSDYVHKPDSSVRYSSLFPSTSLSLDVPLMCRVEWPQRIKFWWLRSRHFPRKLEPPTCSCNDILPQRWCLLSSVRVWMAWDPLRAMEQFLLPNFPAERRKKSKDNEHFKLGSSAHLWDVSCMWAFMGQQLCMSELHWGSSVYFHRGPSELFLIVKTLLNLLDHHK